MTKIQFLGRSCKAYLRLYADHGPDLKICCETCGRLMHKHGHYDRTVTSKSESVIIPIYRWLCPHCRTTVSILPDFLVPWARFTTWIREAAMKRKIAQTAYQKIAETVTTPSIGVSRSTIKRWWRRHLERVSGVALWIAGQLASSSNNENPMDWYGKPAAATPVETAAWLMTLLPLFTRNPTPVRGYWPCLHTRIAPGLWL